LKDEFYFHGFWVFFRSTRAFLGRPSPRRVFRDERPAIRLLQEQFCSVRGMEAKAAPGLEITVFSAIDLASPPPLLMAIGLRYGSNNAR
jgi:hypothetical protein